MRATSGSGPSGLRVFGEDRGHSVLDLLVSLVAGHAIQILVNGGVPQSLLGFPVVDVYANDPFLVGVGIIPAPGAIAAPAAMAPSPTTTPTVSAVEARVPAFNDVALT